MCGGSACLLADCPAASLSFSVRLTHFTRISVYQFMQLLNSVSFMVIACFSTLLLSFFPFLTWSSSLPPTSLTLPLPSQEFEKICAGGLAASTVSQVLVERSLLGWKEYEVRSSRASPLPAPPATPDPSSRRP